MSVLTHQMTASFMSLPLHTPDNLKAANIPLSCDTLDARLPPKGIGAIRLAPDSKIMLLWHMKGVFIFLILTA